MKLIKKMWSHKKKWQFWIRFFVAITLSPLILGVIFMERIEKFICYVFDVLPNIPKD